MFLINLAARTSYQLSNYSLTRLWLEGFMMHDCLWELSAIYLTILNDHEPTWNINVCRFAVKKNLHPVNQLAALPTHDVTLSLRVDNSLHFVNCQVNRIHLS